MRKILAEILFCAEEDVGNVLLHMITGATNVAIPILLHAINLSWVGISLGAIFAWGFIKYQRIEQKEIFDKCYPDLQGWLYGIAFVSIGYAIIRLVF